VNEALTSNPNTAKKKNIIHKYEWQRKKHKKQIFKIQEASTYIHMKNPDEFFLDKCSIPKLISLRNRKFSQT
jgi:hypothetical protein